jgi:hypothetical protein
VKLLGHTTFKGFRNRALAGATAWAVKLLYLTVRFKVLNWDRAKLQGWHGSGVIYALWHNVLMLPLGHESRIGCHALLSPGRDGEFATRVVARFGVRAIRGSTSRQGVGALLQVIRAAQPGTTFAVTPDGPRGPRYRFQPGAAWLASRTGLPIVPIGIAMDRAWKLRSWDRYRIPKPFCRVHMIFGNPVHVPRELDRTGIEAARLRLEEELFRVSREASHLAGCAWPD